MESYQLELRRIERKRDHTIYDQREARGISTNLGIPGGLDLPAEEVAAIRSRQAAFMDQQRFQALRR